MLCLRYSHFALLTMFWLPSLAAANVIITEVLADPPEGPAGDTNRDGRHDPHEDEFIELYNAGSRRISLAGWRLGDAGALSEYFRFPPGAVIDPGSYVVLFGGGNPSGFTVPVYIDDGTIGDGLTDSGESIHLINKRGDEVASLFQWELHTIVPKFPVRKIFITFERRIARAGDSILPVAASIQDNVRSTKTTGRALTLPVAASISCSSVSRSQWVLLPLRS